MTMTLRATSQKLKDFSQNFKPENLNASDIENALASIRYTIAEIENLLENKKSFLSEIPVFIMRQWTVGSIHKARTKLKVAEKKLLSVMSARPDIRKEKLDKAKLNVTFAFLWLSQALSLSQTKSVITEALENNSAFLLNKTGLQKGDIVLSYKTYAYLRKDILASLIRICTASSITHSMIVTDTPENLLCSSPSCGGLNTIPNKTHKGEIFIVMRIRNEFADEREKVLESLDKWKDLALSQASVRSEKYKFAEIKSWVASITGFVYVLSGFLFARLLTPANIFKNGKGVFCSEIIDLIYKDAGLYICPRSEHDAVIGPVELFHSPYLYFKGFIAKEEDYEIIQKEFTQQFNLDKVLEKNKAPIFDAVSS